MTINYKNKKENTNNIGEKANLQQAKRIGGTKRHIIIEKDGFNLRVNL